VTLSCCRDRLPAWGRGVAALQPGRRTVVALWLALAAFALLDGSAPSASLERVARHVQSSSSAGLRGDVAAAYDLYASYPNAGRHRGYFLRGVNEYGSATSSSGPQRTSLWFQPQGDGSFRQFNTTPYRECHWDLLRWGPGERGLLVYLATQADCYSDHTTIVFRPGIAYMPKRWALSERWSDDGVSDTVYSQSGIPVCAGTNTWHSRVIRLARMPNGGVAVHTQTNEIQVLSPIVGAPSSASCPVGQVTRFGWQENFYVGGDLTVRRQDGSAIGSDVGLARTVGGNPAATRQAGHPQWDSVFDSWDAFPPADAGTVTTTTTNVASASTGNTITFTYTAPSGGVRDGSLAIDVPPGWTPPVTIDALGCTVATVGTVTTRGKAITVSALTLPPKGQAVITYGATSGGSCTAGDGATASKTAGAPVWQVQVTLRDGGPFTNLRLSPSIDVGPADGSGMPG
jgi:hypothetical protein